MKGIIGKKKIEYKINSYCIVKKVLSKFIVLIFTKRNHY